MRDLTYNQKRLVLAALLVLDLVFAVNYYARLGLFASGARETVIVGWVLTVGLALYMDPRPDSYTVISPDAGCAMCGQPLGDDGPFGTVEVRRRPRDLWRATVHVDCLRRTLRPDVAATVNHASAPPEEA
jgi:hypothetical protein